MAWHDITDGEPDLIKPKKEPQVDSMTGSVDPYEGHCRGACVKCGMTIHDGIKHRRWCKPNTVIRGK